MIDFKPDLNHYNKFNVLSPFKFHVREAFPYLEADFDALNEYKLLSLVVKYLNQTIANMNIAEENIGIEEENIQALYNAYSSLQDYINNYFDNLDVQDEINNKLNDMVEDGTFERIVGDLLIKKLDYFKIYTSMSESEIQEILNKPNSKVLEFEKGIYNFTNTLIINSNTTLILNGSTLNSSNRHLFYNFKQTDTDILGYNGSHNIKISNGRITSAISFLHGKNIEFEDIEFYHINNDHSIEICACKNVLVHNCLFEGVLTQPSNREYVECVQLENATHQNFPWLADGSSTYDNTACDNIEVSGCKFYNTDVTDYTFYSAVGGHTYVQNFPHKNISIHDNEFYNADRFNIRLHNVDFGNIINNKIINNDNTLISKGIYLYNECKNIDISNNIVDGVDNPIYIANGSENVKIINNIFDNVQEFNPADQENENICINYRGVRNLIITNNVFNNIFGALINSISNDMENTSTYFEKNTVTNNNPLNKEVFYWRCRFYGTKNLYFNNNVFDENLNDGYIMRINEKLNHIVMKNNFRNKLRNKIIGNNGYTGNYNDIYNVYFEGYSGDSLVDTDTELNFPYNNFNTMVIVTGTGSNTYTLKLQPFTIPANNLDARTWAIGIYSGTVTDIQRANLTFNSNGTFKFTCTNPNIHLRKIYFINE